MFKPRLNGGGFSGSHLHLEGVKEMTAQHFPVKPSSLSFRNFLTSSELPLETLSEPLLSDCLVLFKSANSFSVLKFAGLEISGVTAATAPGTACSLGSGVITSKSASNDINRVHCYPNINTYFLVERIHRGPQHFITNIGFSNVIY